MQTNKLNHINAKDYLNLKEENIYRAKRWEELGLRGSKAYVDGVEIEDALEFCVGEKGWVLAGVLDKNGKSLVVEGNKDNYILAEQYIFGNVTIKKPDGTFLEAV